MTRTTNPDSRTLAAYFTSEEHREIKSEAASLDLSFTEYFLYLRKAFKAAPKKVRK